MKKGKNQRGFDLVEFIDTYGAECSLQKSSTAFVDRIWLGVDDPKPQIMCRDAIRLGLRKETGGEADNGWCDFEIPKDVLITSRMHLSREQVGKLLPYLIGFYLSGEVVRSRRIKLPKIESDELI